MRQRPYRSPVPNPSVLKLKYIQIDKKLSLLTRRSYDIKRHHSNDRRHATSITSKSHRQDTERVSRARSDSKSFLKLVQTIIKKIENDEHELINQKPAGSRTTKQNSKKNKKTNKKKLQTSTQRLKVTPLEILALERCKQRLSKYFRKFLSTDCSMREFKHRFNPRHMKSITVIVTVCQ